MVRQTLLGFLLLYASECWHPSSADAADAVADRMVGAFKQWSAENGFTRSNIAVVRGGRVVEQAAYGNTSITAQHPIASLSKVVTGVCATKLVEAGRLRYDSKLGDLLAAFMKQSGRPSDARLTKITVAQLLTHSSGMTDDMIRGAAGHASLWALARLALTRPLGANPGEKFNYTNVNYVFLDAIIETVTGQSYEAACRRLVLAPVGSGQARLYYGGLRPSPTWVDWQMSATEFARFMAYFDKASSPLTLGVEQWPKFERTASSSYSIGVGLRRTPDGIDFTHNGGFSWTANGRTDSYGALFVYWSTGLGFVITYSPPNDRARDELERKLSAIAHTSSDQRATPAVREPNTDRPGSDYRAVDMPNGDPDFCLDACRADDRCRSYTYVAPGIQGTKARCWLKSDAPSARSNSCCTSGVIR